MIGVLLVCPLFSHGGVRANSLAFEPNRGQTNREARFVARALGGGAILIEDHAIVLARSAPDGDHETIRLEFDGANPTAVWQTVEPGPGTTSYIKGRDRARWL